MSEASDRDSYIKTHRKMFASRSRDVRVTRTHAEKATHSALRAVRGKLPEPHGRDYFGFLEASDDVQIGDLLQLEGELDKWQVIEVSDQSIGEVFFQRAAFVKPA